MRRSGNPGRIGETLVIEVNVEQLARIERLRDGVDEIQTRHVLVRYFGIDADHLRVIERGDERQHRADRRQ